MDNGGEQQAYSISLEKRFFLFYVFGGLKFAAYPVSDVVGTIPASESISSK
ncbi:hypothetical protein BLGI_1036 [Brevibacillus laterosporus GI-9]|nr:hypothetical protein BLGI_1036 [Brevibacillus laterosporus GI-9]